MIPLNKLKKDVQFNKEFTGVVDAMKGIAAARYFTLEKQLSVFEKFFKVAGEFLTVIDFDQVDQWFLREVVEIVSKL